MGMQKNDGTVQALSVDMTMYVVICRTMALRLQALSMTGMNESGYI